LRNPGQPNKQIHADENTVCLAKVIIKICIITITYFYSVQQSSFQRCWIDVKIA